MMLGGNCSPCCGPTCTAEQFSAIASRLPAGALTLHIQHQLPTQDAASFLIGHYDCWFAETYGEPSGNQICSDPSQKFYSPIVFAQQLPLPSSIPMALDAGSSYVTSDQAVVRFVAEFVDSAGLKHWDAFVQFWMVRSRESQPWFPGTRCDIRVDASVRTFCNFKSIQGLSPPPEGVSTYTLPNNGSGFGGVQTRKMIVASAPVYVRCGGDSTNFFLDPNLPADSGGTGASSTISQRALFRAGYPYVTQVPSAYTQTLSFLTTLSTGELVSYTQDSLIIAPSVSSIDAGARPAQCGVRPMQKWIPYQTVAAAPAWIKSLTTSSLSPQGAFVSSYQTADVQYADAPPPSVQSVSLVMQF